jgi:hypothetical protein
MIACAHGYHDANVTALFVDQGRLQLGRAVVMLPEIVWEKVEPAAERAAAAAALSQPGLLETTLVCLYGMQMASEHGMYLRVRHLATGGAKRVYLVTGLSPDGKTLPFILKQFLPIRLAYLPPGATVAGADASTAELDARLLERMVWAAGRIDQEAPGLCPRFGGFWEWTNASGQLQRAMTEAYVEGHSLDRWKAILEDQFVQGALDFAQYTRRRQTLERIAIAAYMRLWDALGRQTFTSDPSPWNVFFTPTSDGFRPVIIDLHSIHDGGTPPYVFQTLEELFGNRDEIRQQALCPGILDALGLDEGCAFLQRVVMDLEDQAEVRRRSGLTPYSASTMAIKAFLASLRSNAPDQQPQQC